MKILLMVILAYLIMAIVSYVAILVFLRPQPLVSERAQDDSRDEMRSGGQKSRDWDVVLVGLPVAVLLSPMVLLVCLYGRARKRR